MQVMMKTSTPTDEAAPMWPLLLLNFRYIRMLLVMIELLGEPLPSVSRKGMSNICMPPTSEVTKMIDQDRLQQRQRDAPEHLRRRGAIDHGRFVEGIGIEVIPAMMMMIVCPNHIHHWMKITRPRATVGVLQELHRLRSRNPARTRN